MIAHIEGIITTDNMYPALIWISSSLKDYKMEAKEGEISFEGYLKNEAEIDDDETVNVVMEDYNFEDEVFPDYDCSNFNRPYGCTWVK